MDGGQSPEPKKSKRASRFFLWWQVDQDEIEHEARFYDDEPLFRSSRGAALICLLISSAITGAIILFGGLGLLGLVDIGMFLFLGLFISLGYRWAMIAAMGLWTFEKVFQVINTPFAIIGALLWWTIYMHFFWQAFKVEQARKAISLTPEKAAAEFR